MDHVEFDEAVNQLKINKYIYIYIYMYFIKMNYCQTRTFRFVSF